MTRQVESAGVKLHVHEEGRGEEAVLLLHGFTGSMRSMRGVARGLSDRWRSVSVDLVGHGASEAPRRVAPYEMTACVDQIGAVLDALSLRRAHLLGYSMGGRVALSFCAAHPERVLSAVLVGASAGIADPWARVARRCADDALAARIERDGVEPFVDGWMAQPLFASQRRLPRHALDAAREERLAQRAHGLAFSLRGTGTGAMSPLHDRLTAIDAPILLAVGAEDAKFRAIAVEMAARLPRARVALVPGAGHAAQLENPDAFLASTRRFLLEATRGDSAAPAAAHPSHDGGPIA